MAVARLGYEIDSSQAVTAESRLNAMAAASGRVEMGAARAGLSTQKLGTEAGKSAAHIGNITAQLNDIGVVLAAGQNPLTIALQQGTQLNQVFAQLGGGRAALSAVGQGFLSLVNPVSLATIGIIAAGSAIAQLAIEGLSFSSSAESFEDTLEGLAEAVEAYRDAADDARLGTKGLLEEYGRASSSLRAVLDDFAAIAKLEAAESINDTTKAIRDMIIATGYFDDINSDFGKTTRFIFGTFNELQKEQVAVGIQFAANLKLLQDSRDNAERIRVAMSLRDILLENAGGVSGLTKEQREFLLALGQTIQQMDILEGASGDTGVNISTASMQTVGWAQAMFNVKSEIDDIISALNSINGGLISGAAKQVEIQALRAGSSLKEARVEAQNFKRETETSQQIANLEERWGAVGTVIGGVLSLGTQAANNLDETLNAEREAARERERQARKGDGARPFDIGTGDIERTIENLRMQSEVVQQWYAQSQEALRMATDAELEIIGGRHEAEQRLQAEHVRRLNSINEGYRGNELDQTQQFFGDLASALAGSNARLAAAAQSFAAIESLINAYRAYNQVLADPTLPWFAKIPAAAGVLAAGLRTVSSIRSLGGSGGGGGGTGGGAAGITAESNQQQQQQTRAIIQVQGLGRTRFSVDEINEIIQGIQDASDDGVIIEGVQLT